LTKLSISDSESESEDHVPTTPTLSKGIEGQSTKTIFSIELKQKSYACLSPTCDVVITTTWGDARKRNVILI